MKCLVIGVGFIGNNVIRRLKDLGHEVEIFDKLFGQDMLDVPTLEEAIQRNDVILQIAAIADLNRFEELPLHGMQVNIWGTVLVANYCAKHDKKLIYISTCCVYGNTTDLPSNEASKCEPSEIYAEAKLAGEHIVKGYHKSFGLRYIILRIATVYGPEMRDSLAPAVFFQKVLAGEPIRIHGDGRQTRTLTYIDDEADGIVAAVTSEAVNTTINISSEEETSVLYLASLIQKVTGQTVPIEYVPNRRGQTFIERIDTSKAKKLLHWRARYSLEDGIKATYEWMKGVWKENE